LGSESLREEMKGKMRRLGMRDCMRIAREIDVEYGDVGKRALGRVDPERVRAARGFLEFDR
jgi:hypothetical protein